MTSPQPVLLITGQRMHREEFLRRWEKLPDLKNAELIDGVVFVSSPVGANHGRYDSRLIGWLVYYEGHTAGCETGNNTTWHMLESEPQPDAWLRIAPKSGGQSADEGIFTVGAPELAIEISESSTSVDFGPKLALYQRAGVKEYITIETLKKRITWRFLTDGSYREIPADADGVFRSRVFSGLWLDGAAFWTADVPRMLQVLQAGLGAAEHEAFVRKLAGGRTL